VTGSVQLRGERGHSIPAAIGFGYVVRGWPFVIRLVVLGIVAALSAGALGIKTRHPDANPLPPLPGAAQVTAHIVRGGQPADFDLLRLRNAYHVRAVVNLRLSGDSERDIAAGFGLDYLSVPVAADGAPTAADLAALVTFVRRYDNGSAVVYVHDDLGGGRAATAGLMLLLLRGQSFGAVMTTLSATDQRRLNSHQWGALVALSQALTEHVDPAVNPYHEAVALRW
jgi:hypothetical protein